MCGVVLSVAEPEHAGAIASIYEPYVEGTAISFETDPPSGREIADRIEAITERYPWFAIERDGRISGYAYASQFRTWDAYRWTVELSVYVERDERGDGLGSTLYDALLRTLTRQGFERAYAAVTVPNPESVGFHEAFGFERVGLFPDVGRKHGTWHDVAWYERSLGGRTAESTEPTDPIPFASCRDERWFSDVLAGASEGTRPHGERI